MLKARIITAIALLVGLLAALAAVVLLMLGVRLSRRR